MKATAEFSPCRRYRFALWRRWSAGPQLLFVMLNPSTADETTDDPTIRRCIGFARAWGFGSLAVGNLFAFRTPKPGDLRISAEPIGAGNDDWLLRLQAGSDLTVAAWGNHGGFLDRGSVVRSILPNLHVLRLTKNGEPQHPLYLPRDAVPLSWVQATSQRGKLTLVSSKPTSRDSSTRASSL
jgi:hypothetical protein